MKTIKIINTTLTVIIFLILGLPSLGDIFLIDYVKGLTKIHQFPEYIVPYLGITKLMAAIVIVVPAFARLKEVAYGGLFFFFVGAIYSHIAIGDGLFGKTTGALMSLLIVITSYLCWLQLKNQQSAGHKFANKSEIDNVTAS